MLGTGCPVVPGCSAHGAAGDLSSLLSLHLSPRCRRGPEFSALPVHAHLTHCSQRPCEVTGTHLTDEAQVTQVGHEGQSPR